MKQDEQVVTNTNPSDGRLMGIIASAARGQPQYKRKKQKQTPCTRCTRSTIGLPGWSHHASEDGLLLTHAPWIEECSFATMCPAIGMVLLMSVQKSSSTAEVRRIGPWLAELGTLRHGGSTAQMHCIACACTCIELTVIAKYRRSIPYRKEANG